MKYEEVTQPMSRMGFVIGFVIVTMGLTIALVLVIGGNGGPKTIKG